MRIAWNVRVAGSIRDGPRRGIARLTISASRPVVAIPPASLAETMARAMRLAKRSSPALLEPVAQCSEGGRHLAWAPHEERCRECEELSCPEGDGDNCRR